MRYATIAFALLEYGVSIDEIILCELIGHESKQPSANGLCRMKPGEMATIIGVSRRWVFYVTKKLEEMGWVTRTKAGIALTQKYISVRDEELNKPITD